MRRMALISIGLAGLLLMLPGDVSYATPSPPITIVNESTRQCYVGIMSDECNWCDPPPGWKLLEGENPYSGGMECPAGYEKIDRLELDCHGYKEPYCCGVFSSQGDCEAMVINATQQECAFVDNINACVLPEGWSKRPTDMPTMVWGCNFNKYKWVDNVTCLTITPTAERLSVENFTKQQPAALPVGGIALIALGASLFMWLGRHRR
jgi:hypothetical protein